jgi:hypothetical protein
MCGELTSPPTYAFTASSSGTFTYVTIPVSIYLSDAISVFKSAINIRGYVLISISFHYLAIRFT